MSEELVGADREVGVKEAIDGGKMLKAMAAMRVGQKPVG